MVMCCLLTNSVQRSIGHWYSIICETQSLENIGQFSDNLINVLPMNRCNASFDLRIVVRLCFVVIPTNTSKSETCHGCRKGYEVFLGGIAVLVIAAFFIIYTENEA